MPIASPQSDAQLLQLILQSKPHELGGALPQSQLVANYSSEGGACGTDLGHIASGAAGPKDEEDDSQQHFSTHSPPIINLSPNLSPTNENQRTSPFYDLRESTRRRGWHDAQRESQQQMHHHQTYYHGIITDDVGVHKSESPSRKRRKTSTSIIDLTNNSPSPPPNGLQCESLSENVRQRRRNPSQRRPSGERAHTPRARRSPGTRRRARDHHVARHGESSPERRAFQPPSHHIHPASLPLQPHQQPQVLLNVDPVQTAGPVTVAPYTIPVCTGPHMPVCTSAGHVPVCVNNGQPTWSFPACSVQLPSCNIQHIPVCSLPQLPLSTHPPPLPQLFSVSHHNAPQNSLAPHPHHHQHHSHHHHHHQHQESHRLQQQPSHFSTANHHHQQQRRHEEEILLDRVRPTAASFHLPPRVFHHAPTLNPSPPLILQEPSVHPTPQDLFGPFQRFYTHQRSLGRRSMRNFPPPSPPYPGFLLHFLAMLGNPPVPPYGRELHDDTTEENYEALLNLAERLGEAKPKGLIKAEIEQLPAYRFNGENLRNGADQTSCVVCMCDFENRQLLRVLPCCHEFHAKCIDKWLKTNRTCPICRADASEIGNQSD